MKYKSVIDIASSYHDSSFYNQYKLMSKNIKYKSVIDRASSYHDSSIYNQDKLISKKTKFQFYKSNQSSLKYRTLYRANSSVYLFDFTTGSLKSLFILLILLMGIYQVFILGIGVNNLNTFENGISLLQLCSDTGINLKQNLNSSFLELFSINFQFSNIDSFKDGFLAFLDLLILPFKSIYQLFSFIFSFLSTGFNLLMGILRLLMGV